MTTEMFAEKYNAIMERAIICSDKARREGLLALEKLIDEEKYYQRDIFELGIRMVIDGTDCTVIEKILTNIINLETDNDWKTLKTIQKEAVIRIQDGMNPRLLRILLNSYVNIKTEEELIKYNET